MAASTRAAEASRRLAGLFEINLAAIIIVMLLQHTPDYFFLIKKARITWGLVWFFIIPH
jgi:hypothetical protein